MPRRPRKSNLLLTDVELTIFRPFWESGKQSLSASDVQLYLMNHGKNNAYTTVKTMIDRMVKRGIFTAKEAQGRFLLHPESQSATGRKSLGRPHPNSSIRQQATLVV